MCLSTAYKGSQTEDNVICKYVSKIEVEGSHIILTDVMGITMDVEGKISYVDLTGGIVVVEETAA